MEPRKFIAVIKSARHMSLSWANSIQSPPPLPTSWSLLLTAQQIKNYDQRLKSSRMWRRVVLWVIQDFRRFTMSSLQGQTAILLNRLTLEDEDTPTFRNVGIYSPTPEELNLQQHRRKRRRYFNNYGVGGASIAQSSSQVSCRLVNWFKCWHTQ